jgi:hypothetical protein
MMAANSSSDIAFNSDRLELAHQWGEAGHHGDRIEQRP